VEACLQLLARSSYHSSDLVQLDAAIRHHLLAEYRADAAASRTEVSLFANIMLLFKFVGMILMTFNFTCATVQSYYGRQVRNCAVTEGRCIAFNDY